MFSPASCGGSASAGVPTRCSTPSDATSPAGGSSWVNTAGPDGTEAHPFAAEAPSGVARTASPTSNADTRVPLVMRPSLRRRPRRPDRLVVVADRLLARGPPAVAAAVRARVDLDRDLGVAAVRLAAHEGAVPAPERPRLVGLELLANLERDQEDHDRQH